MAYLQSKQTNFVERLWDYHLFAVYFLPTVHGYMYMYISIPYWNVVRFRWCAKQVWLLQNCDQELGLCISQYTQFYSLNNLDITHEQVTNTNIKATVDV